MLEGAKAAAALRALSAGDVDRITGMDARGDTGWEDIVVPLRDEVADAYEADRFHVIRYASDVAREIGEGLVPTSDRAIIEELLIIGAAYNREPEVTEGDLCKIIGFVLAECYVDGAMALVQWVGEQDDEDEDEPEPDETED